MWTLEKRYRNFLTKRAQSNPSPAIIEMQWQMLPWLIPVATAGTICYLFDLKPPENLLALAPAAAIAIIGIAYVGLIFLIKGPVAAYKSAKQTEKVRK